MTLTDWQIVMVARKNKKKQGTVVRTCMIARGCESVMLIVCFYRGQWLSLCFMRSCSSRKECRFVLKYELYTNVFQCLFVYEVHCSKTQSFSTHFKCKILS